MLGTKTLTVEAFDEFVQLPENADKLFEYIGGEVIEVPSNPFASEVGGTFYGEIYIYLKTNPIGHLTGEAGGYIVSGERYTPDVGFILKSKQPELAKEGYNPNPPDLAVEVDFPSTYQSQKTLRTKVINYLAAGTMVWVVLPELQEIEVYVPGKPIKIVKIDGILDGGDVLPGFTLAVKDVFRS